MIERIQSTIKAELALKEGQNQKLVKALQAKQADLQGELAKQKELHQQNESVRQLIAEAEEKLA